MNRKIGINYLSFLLLLLTFSLTACTQSPVFELYEGRPLEIAVIGEPPEVNEEQVVFREISFDQIASEELDSYDAVIIRENNLSEAAEGKYADIYLNSTIPFFFISANNHIPFTVKETGYNESWHWTTGKGESYAVGVLLIKESESLKSWGFSIGDDYNEDEHIKDIYSSIFKEIDELDH
ncbi:hypothetical protein [Bacillus sp. PS06]|uniref:hypothetical protein n=1 Tax=Bacillus sp. PS06 TaxID=2764176 RepID=UPI00177CC93E|nr:hypothetical protein [Bacillus sp. PS06]MBD8069626.1 hypothetical protein [Bacillus sp. PS06]